MSHTQGSFFRSAEMILALVGSPNSLNVVAILPIF
jgi:hypothetical protein